VGSVSDFLADVTNTSGRNLAVLVRSRRAPWKSHIGGEKTQTQMQTARESNYLNVARVADICLMVSWVWMLRSRRLEDPYFPLLVCAGLLCPLAVGLYFLIRSPRVKEWVFITLIHQALAIVSGALASIFLLSTLIPSAAPISETWPVIVFCSVIAGLQLPILFGARYFLGNSKFKIGNSKAAIGRTVMVFYFAVFFLLLK